MKSVRILLLCGLALAAPFYFVHAQTTTDTTGQPVMTDPNEDVSNLSDLEVELKALEMATPLAASNEPSVGNFYSAQHAPGSAVEWPPLPGNIFNLPVWPLDTNIFVLDDLNFNYGGDSSKMSKVSSGTSSGMLVRDNVDINPGDGGGDTNAYNPPAYPNVLPDYGTNLYISQWGMVSNILTGIATNTLANVEYEIQTNSTLTTTNWVGTGQFILGSDATNWTQFILPPPPSTNNLFFRLQSWASSDGSGLPTWWELKYLGQSTNVDPYADPTGDGYTLLQDFQNGWNPNVPITPPAPQVGITFNVNSSIATISWPPLPGPVINYLVSETDYQKGITTNFTLPADTTSFLDNLSGESPYNTNADWGGPTEFVSYSVEGEYSGGNSASGTAMLQLNLANPNFSLISGPGANLYVVGQGLPSDLQELEFYRQSQQYSQDGANYWQPYGDGSNYPMDLTDGYFSVPAADITGGIAPIPSSQMYAFGAYQLWVRSVRTNGLSSDWISLGVANNNVFVDARQQIKDNVRAKLSGAPENSPFDFNNISYTTNLVYSGFQNSQESFDPLLPIEDNYEFRNFVFNSTNIETNSESENILGAPNGVNDNYGPLVDSGFYSVDYASFITTNSPIAPPSLLTSAQATWFYNDQSMIVPYFGFPPPNLTIATATNYYGLPYLSAEIVVMTNVVDPNYFTLYPGDTFPYEFHAEYSQATEPNLQPDGYYFARIGYDPVPEESTSPSSYPQGQSFATTNTTPLMIAGVGQSMQQVAGYARFVLTNGYPGMYAYEGQYFDQAYALNTNGNPTTTTGVLSPYGSFFPTQPGPVALTTMADPDTGQQGTCTVYAVSLALDANHDGTMNTSFNGPDATSQASPMKFWVNDGHDEPGYDGNLDVDLEVPPASPNYSAGQITCPRDLENFARLWVCGLPQLPTSEGYTITLSMSPSSGNPAINLYPAYESAGGTEYLTNSSIAAAQINETYSIGFNVYAFGTNLATISASKSYTLPVDDSGNLLFTHFLFEGAGVGAGELTLTISKNNNVICQTSAYLDLHEIQDFYERAEITNNTSGSISNWTSAVESVQPATSSALGSATNLIVFVHGFNVGNWDWLDDSGTVLKRLYWAGYQGDFATVKWPCEPITAWTAITETTSIFNNSEIKSYKAASALKSYLSQLRSRFPGYQLNVLAHSQGNAIMGEAIEQGAPFDNYILTQAAMPASSYYVNAPTDSTLTTAESLYATPILKPMGYQGVYTNMTGSIISFFNTNDSVLSIWIADQSAGKPNGYAQNLIIPTPYYSYSGTSGYYNGLFSSYLVADPQESRAMISRSLTQPIGRLGPSAGQTQQGVVGSTVDLAGQFGFTTGFSEHSAEWTRPIQTSLPYYKQILVQIQPIP